MAHAVWDGTLPAQKGWGLASQLQSQLLIPGPVVESARRRGSCPVDLPLWPQAELPFGAAPQKPVGCWPGPGLSLCWCLEGCMGDILHSGGLPDSTLIFQGGWLPGPLGPCLPGLAGCAGWPGTLYRSLREAMYLSKHRPMEGAGVQGAAKGCAGPEHHDQGHWSARPRLALGTQTRLWCWDHALRGKGAESMGLGLGGRCLDDRQWPGTGRESEGPPPSSLPTRPLHPHTPSPGASPVATSSDSLFGFLVARTAPPGSLEPEREPRKG